MTDYLHDHETLTILPVPIEVPTVRYRCAFCPKTYARRLDTLRHINERCWYRADQKPQPLAVDPADLWWDKDTLRWRNEQDYQ